MEDLIGNAMCLQYKQSWNSTQSVLLLRKKGSSTSGWGGSSFMTPDLSGYPTVPTSSQKTTRSSHCSFMLQQVLHTLDSVFLCPWRWVPWWNNDTTSHRRQERIVCYPRRASLVHVHFLPSLFGHCQVAAKAICKLKISSEQAKRENQKPVENIGNWRTTISCLSIDETCTLTNGASYGSSNKYTCLIFPSWITLDSITKT